MLSSTKSKWTNDWQHMCDCKCVLSAKVHACYNTGKKKNSTKFCGDRRQKWHENSTDLQLILSLDMWAHSTYHALFVCYIVSCQNFVQFFFFFSWYEHEPTPHACRYSFDCCHAWQSGKICSAVCDTCKASLSCDIYCVTCLYALLSCLGTVCPLKNAYRL